MRQMVHHPCSNRPSFPSGSTHRRNGPDQENCGWFSPDRRHLARVYHWHQTGGKGEICSLAAKNTTPLFEGIAIRASATPS